MLVQYVIVLCFLVDLLDSCLATPATEPITTTTMTTTTTATEPPFPCSVCPKVYDPSCTGPGVPNWCAPAADVGLTYILGAVAALLGSDSNTCSTQFVCPFGTTSRAIIFGIAWPASPVVFAYCSETGPNAGTWYYQFPPSIPTPVQLQSLTCFGLIQTSG